jgi:hypothetical protein
LITRLDTPAFYPQSIELARSVVRAWMTAHMGMFEIKGQV